MPVSCQNKSTVISTTCFKMSLVIFFLSILITSQIVNCEMINNNNYDTTYLFVSYMNKNNKSYINSIFDLKNFNNYNDKRLMIESKSATNKNQNFTKIMTTDKNNVVSTNLKENKFENNRFFTFWPNKRKSHQEQQQQQQMQHFNITPNIHISPKSYLNQNNLQLDMNLTNEIINPYNDSLQLIKIIMDGLALKILPDFRKANISQIEYSSKYIEYLDRIHKRSIQNSNDNEFDNNSNALLSLMSISHNYSNTKIYRERRSPMTTKIKNKTISSKSILLRFPLELSSDIQATDIDEANIRLLLIITPGLAVSRQFKHNRMRNRQNVIDLNKEKFATDFKQNITISRKTKKPKNNTNLNSKKKSSHFLNMKVYQLLGPNEKLRIDGQRIEVKFDNNKIDESTSQWLQFDVTKVVEELVANKKQNLSLEIRCDNCLRNGARIIDYVSEDNEDEDSNIPEKYGLTPVLNIIGRLGTHREKRSKHYHNQMTERPKKKKLKSDCYKDNQRCCRHSMEVVFKEIKGFEFIIQPKIFDAGYCRGRCPPRYNPAHHHALLQGLIWKQDKKNIPRPCCAPSKLVALEVLHVDEKDNEKLKISTWTDMRVLECACS